MTASLFIDMSKTDREAFWNVFKMAFHLKNLITMSVNLVNQTLTVDFEDEGNTKHLKQMQMLAGHVVNEGGTVSIGTK